MRRRKRLSIALAATLCLLFMGLTGYWFWASEALAEGIERWRGQQIERGYAIAYDGPQMSGFPFALTVTFDQPKVTSPQDLTWEGPTISGKAKLWDPFTIDLQFPGNHRLRLAEGGERKEAEIVAAEAQGRVVLAFDGQVDRAMVDLGALRMEGPGLDPVSAERLTARLGPLQEANGDDPETLELVGEALALQLPAGHGGPLGNSLARLSFDSTVIGGIPRGKPAVALPLWRDAGGLWRFRRLAANWGPLDLQATGRLALDRVLRPAGQFDTRLKGAEAIIDRLIESGDIKPEAAFAARLAVAALGRRDATSDATVLEAPITLRDGLLYLGPVPLFPIAPVL
ncbi:DUF2125 domain-containing protein [Pelagibius sp.]|uniref:DUF2125 domain-containing protein n=1 Tax=Pelagibius sp. TaxID=1931238 RepID=UPI003BAE4A3A